MMPNLSGFSIEVKHDLDQLVQQGVRAITAAVEAAARELRETHIPDEAPSGATGALASDWREREVDPLTRIVFPGRDAFYAHIVAGGRQAVRPVNARALPIAGEFRAHAGPASADPFQERAIAALEGRTQQLIEDALAAEGV